ncbi:hypothetical protein TNCV_1101391 [Trichonephila clavipes]|nr:hypothetical protein TNCV_1101391 [Trichonephila clavipes]
MGDEEMGESMRCSNVRLFIKERNSKTDASARSISVLIRAGLAFLSSKDVKYAEGEAEHIFLCSSSELVETEQPWKRRLKNNIYWQKDEESLAKQPKRDLKASGQYACRSTVYNPLKARHHVVRRKWDAEHRDWMQSDWSQVLFIDES